MPPLIFHKFWIQPLLDLEDLTEELPSNYLILKPEKRFWSCTWETGNKMMMMTLRRAYKDVDTSYLAETTSRLSGAHLFNIVNSAAIEAIKRNFSKITMNLLENARENVILGLERKGLTITPDTKEITAYHESGHALMALMNSSQSKKQIIRVTMVPRGDALGYVRYMLKNELMQTKEELQSHLEIGTCTTF